MKRTTATLIVLICFSGLQAQYKKASFFDKDGRTYGLGIESHFLGDGRGTVPGFVLSFGRDRNGSRLFSTTDIRVLPSFKFSYETTDRDDNLITVSGKSKLHLIWAMNWGFYLLNNDDEEQKLKPYVTAGFNVVIHGGLKQLDNEDFSYDVAKLVPQSQFSTGLGGGVGTIFNLSSLLSLKLEGGYTYQLNFNTDYSNQDNLYFMFPPHAYASLGLRFRIVSE